MSDQDILVMAKQDPYGRSKDVGGKPPRDVLATSICRLNYDVIVNKRRL